MNTTKAAQYLGVTKYALKRLRDSGAGPRCTPPVEGHEGFEYLESDLDAWMAEQEARKASGRHKTKRELCPPVVREADAHLYPSWWPQMDAEDWRELVSQARTAAFVEGLGLVADRSLDRTQRWPSGRTGHTGWHAIGIGAVHWCFDTRGDAPAWVRANVDAIRIGKDAATMPERGETL